VGPGAEAERRRAGVKAWSSERKADAWGGRAGERRKGRPSFCLDFVLFRSRDCRALLRAT
jgi:hypothetical protein